MIVMMNITFNLNVAARFFVVGNNQDNKNDIFQVLHRGLRSRLCQERSVRDQALSPNLLARLDGQSWKNYDFLSAVKEITTLHVILASFSLSKKCQNQFGQGGPPSQFGQCPKARFFYLASLLLSTTKKMSWNSVFCLLTNNLLVLFFMRGFFLLKITFCTKSPFFAHQESWK